MSPSSILIFHLLVPACTLALPARTNQRVLTRRGILTGTAIALQQPCKRVWALGEDSTTIVATGTITLPKDLPAPESTTSALYVTVRPAPPEGAAGAMQAGKVAPLASARFAAPLVFPFDFSLTTSDLTAEYAETPAAAYERLDLLVSVRLDGDGVAATRGPDDLVGRGTLVKRGSSQSTEWKAATIALTGRGLTGRLLTGGSK